ncbi:MAG: hypothetical protein ACK5ZC_03580 [Pirellulaceae bacterium]
MKRSMRWLLLCGCMVAMLPHCLTICQAQQSTMAKEPTWQWPSTDTWVAAWRKWAEEKGAVPALQIALDQVAIDDSLRGPAAMEKWLALGAAISPGLKQLEGKLLAVAPPAMSDWHQLAGLVGTEIPSWAEPDLRLVMARWFAQHRLYDESAEVLQGVKSEQVVDPSSFFFYEALCAHHQLDRKRCLDAVDRLLEREAELTGRYSTTAKLMRTDIQPLKEDSLDEVARLMTDVERRLDLGRAGEKVQAQEKAIVEKLDKLIDQVEQQIQQQQQQQQQQRQQQQQQRQQNQQRSGGSQPQPSTPLEDSRAQGQSGPGDIDRKKLDPQGNWGDLPPSQRQQAIQDLTRDLPSHYREVIEAYFRRLAAGSQPEGS